MTDLYNDFAKILVDDLAQLNAICEKHELIDSAIPKIEDGTITETELIGLMLAADECREHDVTLVIIFLGDALDVIRILRSESKPVVTICYGIKREWKSDLEAMMFFQEAMDKSYGAEHDRYAEIFKQLSEGLTYCTDSSGNM